MKIRLSNQKLTVNFSSKQIVSPRDKRIFTYPIVPNTCQSQFANHNSINCKSKWSCKLNIHRSTVVHSSTAVQRSTAVQVYLTVAQIIILICPFFHENGIYLSVSMFTSVFGSASEKLGKLKKDQKNTKLLKFENHPWRIGKKMEKMQSFN